ncbi:unnamed protein product [Dovyalis caffra]|uniref:RING-type E3 ubiquitin transferase n=1 Tax=Dovyalis caffra TaxID=77055 RepID=A0AAV1QP99_9ROSI|nr:unnamed protein product [Dovyalis caffra]
MLTLQGKEAYLGISGGVGLGILGVLVFMTGSKKNEAMGYYGVAGLNCTESRFGRNGPDIRFPFRIKNRQPEHCGYPGFDLSCSESNHTVLEFPASIKFYIESIDYNKQVMTASYARECPARQRLNFNLSASCFQMVNSDTANYTLFNCSSDKERYGYFLPIPCLSALNYDVLAVNSYHSVDDSDLLSCTKMFDIFSVPVYMSFQGNYTFPLFWCYPKCGSCEAKGKKCRLRDYSSKLETECYDNSIRGMSLVEKATGCRYNLSTNGDPHASYDYKWNGWPDIRTLLSQTMIFMNCANPVKSPLYVATASCLNYGTNSSNISLRTHSYVNVGVMNISDLMELCS